MANNANQTWTAEFLTKKYGSPILKSDEVAEILRVTKKTFQNGLSDGKYPIKSWRRGFYHVEEVARLLDSQVSGEDPRGAVARTASRAASRKPRSRCEIALGGAS
jgi:hypothetical protein